LLAEFGVAVPQGTAYLASRVPDLIEDAPQQASGDFRRSIDTQSVRYRTDGTAEQR
jgi:hypothetical protein